MSKSAEENYLHDTLWYCNRGNAMVHFWRYRGVNNVGHIALTLPHGTHISFWPSERSKKCVSTLWFAQPTVAPLMDQTLAKDIGLESCLPDDRLLIPSSRFDEDKIIAWWQDYLQTGKYELIASNCAVIVCLALHHGGFRFDYRQKSLPQYSFGLAQIIEALLQANGKDTGTFLKPSDAHRWLKDAITEWPDAAWTDKLRYFFFG